MNSDLERFRRMASALPGLPVKVDKRTKPIEAAADDRDHQGKTKGSCARERLRCAAYAEPDRHFGLMRAREDALTGERRPETALPRHVRLFAQFEKEIQLLDKKRVIVVHGKAIQRIGFAEGTTSHNDLGATFRNQVDRREILKDPDWDRQRSARSRHW
jgi:hypothetical protein